MASLLTLLAFLRKYHDLVAALAIVLATTGAFNLGKHCGKKQARAEEAIKAQQSLQQANDRYREREREHEQAITKLAEKYRTQDLADKVVDVAASRDFATGVRRMRLPTAARCPNTPKAGAPAVRTDAAESAELAPATAEALYTIAADGDTAIRQLTALQGWAREAVALCSGGKP